MINAFRSYHPLRLVLAATLLLSIVLPVVQMVCSLDGEASPRERHEAVVSERGITGFSDCFLLNDVFTSSTQKINLCQQEAASGSVQGCEVRPVEIAEVLPAPSTEELSQLLVAPLSFLLEGPQADFSEPLATGAFPRAADVHAPRPFVSLRVLFSSFLI